MTADIRSAAQREARGADMHHELSSAHYTRAFTAGAVWAAERGTPTLAQLELAIMGRTATAGARAVLALMDGLAEGDK